MLNCDWAKSLTRYDCQTLTGLDGLPCLEIGTPFSMPDGAAINIYITQAGESHIKVSDNADTLFHFGGLGLDVWQAARLNSLRDLLSRNKMQLGPKGEAFILAGSAHAANGFALAVTGLLALSSWAGDQLRIEAQPADIVAEIEPYVIARNPTAEFKRHPKVRGASSSEHMFDLRHGNDLIDIIAPDARSTGSAMRKAGDVQNGPFSDHLSPLIIVDDRLDAEKAMNEIGILGSVVRAMPASRLMQLAH
ncbi:hypothetical protein CHU94_08125 [Rhodoferax sp. TH121]|uniref:DUF1828 domain-containing protein n=1 Tax=Rhodoferax sp. TH121 TaxID=2022803 RepID=UPI000B966A60|nr:DUF1828 domain-containing protein [Rhodoferax sp. TH121]OYQ41068.1 hypothetical protein CHU94_08125 [Rhodoferax sp. TH121]